ALSSAVRFARVFRLASGRYEKRALAVFPRRRRRRNPSPLPWRLADPRNGNRNQERRRASDRFHAATWREPGHHPDRGRIARQGLDADGTRYPVWLRAGRTMGAPPEWWAGSNRGTGWFDLANAD